MSGNFRYYARYYDLLYRDKDYAGEAAFIHQLVRRHRPAAATLFEMGCGTGKHALEFARLGYQAGGIDLSEDMVARSRALHAGQPPALAARLSARVGDVRHHRESAQFDAVLSLFHVINYQTTDADLEATMATAASLTRPGGVFLFDFWYGPAVLSDPPCVRVRRLEDDVIGVVRIAEPVMHPNTNRVDVNYHVFATEKATGVVTEVRETHAMRYLFLPEMNALLARAGFQSLETGAWLKTDKPLGTDTWYGWMIARRQK